MGRTQLTLALCTSLAGYFVISKLLFDKVNLVSKIVIDEEFHVPQGLAYCNFTFDTWNPKITTLPGLYLVSTLILGPLELCSIYWLRFMNLIASVLNLYLIYVCFKLYNRKQVSSWINLLSSINLTLLPPLYFFSHLYYTDVISITFILLLVIFNKREKHVLASIFGLMAILMRQTNVIWVIMVFGQYCLKEVFLHSARHSKKAVEGDIPLQDAIDAIWNLRNSKVLKSLPINTWLNIVSYLTVLASFAFFIFVNGGIVVGDKTAHAAAIHVPQLFYFVTFCLLFAWPYVIDDVVDFIKFTYRSNVVSLLIMMICAIVVFANSLEHLYLLADNRHYTFYVWNKFYRKYFWFRYVMIPVYYFGFFALFSRLHARHNSGFSLTYIVCTALVLIPQKMIEVRYFLIPYILFRLQFRNVQIWQLLAEFVFYCAVNAATFYLFFTKEIYWSNYKDVQRLIW